MLDPILLRKDLQTVVDRLRSRGVAFDTERFNDLESRRKSVQTETESLQARRNALAKQIGQLKAKGEDASAVMAESQALPGRLKQLEDELAMLQQQLNELLMSVPNLPHASVPVGASSDENVEVRRWLPGQAGPDGNPAGLGFEPRDHVAVGEPLGLDFDTAAKLSGARFSFMRGQMARLHRALAQFMLDLQTGEHGYTECYTPYIVNSSTLYGTGQLPKFKDDMFFVTKGGGDDDPKVDEHGKAFVREDQYLISTSEITLTSVVRDTIVPGADLPLRMTAHTPCFRSEAGSGGRDTRGMIRQHQFDKVEMVQVVHPEQSYEALEQMTGHAEAVLRRLGLPTGSCCCAPATWALARPRPMTWRSGCRRRTPGARFPRSRTARTSRHAACRRVSAPTPRASPSSSIRSMAPDWRSGAPWWPCWRIISRPMAVS